MNANNIVLTQALKLELESISTSKLMFQMKELTNTTLSNSVDETPVAGSGGSPIAILKTNKTASATASNGYVNMDALAAQTGGDKVKGTVNSPIEEIIDVVGGKAILKYKVVGAAGSEFPFIYGIDNGGDISILDVYEISSTADATHFSFDPTTNELTLPTGFVGTQVGVRYTGESLESLTISNAADTFSRSGRAIMTWLGIDKCDNDKEYIVLVTFPKATVSGTYDLSAGNDTSTHDITITALGGACDKDKSLWKWEVIDQNGYTVFASTPTVTSVTPATGDATGNETVTIAGTGFATPATVMFGTNAATNVSVASATILTCTTPAGTGATNVTVTVGGKTSIETVTYTYS